MSRTHHHGDHKKYEMFGDIWRWYANEPKWWVKLHKHRPKRAQERVLIREVLTTGEDNGIWPLDKKPWIYYW